MRYKAVFIAGVAVGFVAGTRAGRGTYDKMAGYARQIAGHPKVQQATNAAQAKATELAKTAAAKAPDYAKSAASKLPPRFGGGSDTDRAADGTAATRIEDDINPDGNLVYPAEGSPSVNGTIRHYTPGSPEANS